MKKQMEGGGFKVVMVYVSDQWSSLQFIAEKSGLFKAAVFLLSFHGKLLTPQLKHLMAPVYYYVPKQAKNDHAKLFLSTMVFNVKISYVLSSWFPICFFYWALIRVAGNVIWVTL